MGRTIGIQYCDYRPHVMREYIAFGQQFGNVRLIMPDQVNLNLDLLILIGGPDVPPSGIPSPFTGAMTAYHRYFYENTLSLYLKHVPVFGICLGAQEITKLEGGSLYSHIEGHRIDDMHKVALLPEWKSRLELKKDVYSVTSRHHMAIKTLPQKYLPVANAITKSGDIEFCEAFIHSHKPIAAVQWHPESVRNMISSYNYKQTGCTFGDPVAVGLVRYLLNLTGENETAEVPVPTPVLSAPEDPGSTNN